MRARTGYGKLALTQWSAVTDLPGGMMGDGYDTGMSLLTAAADCLEAAATDDEPPGEELSRLAERIRRYLAVSRSTTPLGLPHVLTAPQNLLTEEMVVRGS